VIAQRHGVIGQQGVDVGQHGPAVGGEEQRALKLVARVQCQNIIVGGAQALQGGGKPRRAAGAAFGTQAGIAVGVPARKVGMLIVGVQQQQFKARLVLRQAGKGSKAQGRKQTEPQGQRGRGETGAQQQSRHDAFPC